MTRRRTTVDTAAARDVVLAACALAGSDDAGDVLTLLMFATAIVISECNPHDPAGAVEAARGAGPPLADLVERVQQLRLENNRAEGSA